MDVQVGGSRRCSPPRLVEIGTQSRAYVAEYLSSDYLFMSDGGINQLSKYVTSRGPREAAPDCLNWARLRCMPWRMGNGDSPGIDFSLLLLQRVNDCRGVKLGVRH